MKVGNKLRKLQVLIGCAVLAGQVSWAAGVYEPATSTLRIGSYNVTQSRIYKGNNNSSPGTRYDAWPRIMKGVQADIWLLQEMFYNDSGVPDSYIADFTAHVRSVTGDNSWNWAADNKGRVTLTRYPIRWSGQVSHRIHATWIDLPTTVSAKDILIINVHFMTLDQSVTARDFIRQVRAGTHSAGIPRDISIFFGGDFNALPDSTRYNNIQNEGFTDMDPAHNGTSERNTIGGVSMVNGSYVSPIGRNHLDFTLLSSDVLFKANSFILNTIIMPLADRNAFGLQQRDVALDANKTDLNFINSNIECDHFPIVVDLRGVLSPNNSAFVSQSVPSTLTVGQTANVSITIKNAGTDIWSTAAGHKLGTQNPRDNKVWAGTNRVALSQNVAPNANHTFTISIKAPTTPGVYNFQWQMVDDAGANLGWFGALTPNVAINVTVPNRAPYFSANPFSMPDAATGTAYSQSISTKAVDPEGGTKTFSKVAGPVWLTVTSTGTIQGTPASVDVGTNSFSVKVTDNGGLSATATMKIKVVAAAQPSLPAVGSIITLKATINGKYVTANYSTDNTMIANKTTVSNYERFKVINATNSIALQCMGNNKFVSINAQDGSKAMVANRTSIGSFEKFKLVLSDGQMAIQSVRNTNYVSAISGGDAPLQAIQTRIGSFEKFTWKVE